MEIDVKYAGLNLSEDELKAINDCSYEIKDVQQFLMAFKIEQQIEKQRYVMTSDNRKVDVFRHEKLLLADILDLPEDEQDKFMKKRKMIYSLHQKVVNTKKKALGAEIIASRQGKYEKIITSRKAELLAYFGRMFTVREVLSMLRTEWGVKDIGEDTLFNFYRDNIDEINRLKEKHRSDYSDLRLTAKTSRLEELTWMYGKLKRKYELTNNREDHKALLSTMESIRKEVEGDRLTIQGQVNLQLQQDVNIHIKNELLKGLTMKEIILGRIAARSGISPLKVINSLNSSYYAKLNRLINSAETIDFEEIQYPSTQPYDFERIQVINDQRVLTEEAEKKKEDEERAKKEAVLEEKDKLKKALLDKLKNNMSNSASAQLNVKRNLLGK